MAIQEWYVPLYRNASFGRYSAQRVKYADFAGVYMTLDHKKFWSRKAAELRADELNAQPTTKESHD